MYLNIEMRTIENPDKFRKNICEKLNAILQNEKRSRNMEKGVYNYALKESDNRKVVKKWDNPFFIQIYVDRLRSVYINLQNPALLEQITNGTLKSHNIAFMTHQEMRPEKWETMIQEKSKRDKNKYETTIEAATDTFKCRKCHSNKCTYYQMQTRSADEPMTTFVTCIDCGNRWKC
jgi:transcription elongation factor S-II